MSNEVRREMWAEWKRSWKSNVFVLLLIVGAFIAFCWGVSSARADFNYCGHGYISSGSVKDVYKSAYNAPSGHHHIYNTYVNVSGYGWIYAHQHDRVC